MATEDATPNGAYLPVPDESRLGEEWPALEEIDAGGRWRAARRATTTERNRQMTTTARPEDDANRVYYANMPTRRARVVVEVDVEWREDDPDYSFSVLALGELDSIRVRNLEVISTEWVRDAT